MRILPALCLLSLMMLPGCGGGGDKVKVVPVSGVLKHNGNALADADIVFYPEKGPVGTAKSDAKGAFQIQTNGQSGGMVGKNKVTVTVSGGAIPPSDGRAHEFKPEAKISPKYSNEAQTDLSVDVPAGGNRDVKLNLTD